MDGGQFADSLKSYAKAILYQPKYTLSHWHRILYAMLGLLGVRNLDSFYARFQDARRPDWRSTADLDNWPGLCFKQAE
jgi:hypothetical protein